MKEPSLPWYDFLAWVGAGLLIGSGWLRTRRAILIVSTVAFIFLLLQAQGRGLTGATWLYVFTLLRNGLFLLSDRYLWAQNRLWPPALIVTGTIVYLWVTPWSAWWVFLPVAGRALGTLGYAQESPVRMKILQLIGLPFWLLFWAMSGLWPGFVADTFKFVVMAMSLPRTKRHYLQKKALADLADASI